MTRFIQLIAASLAWVVVAISANAQIPPGSTAAAKAKIQRDGEQQHRLIIQVDTNDAAAMNLALNNAANVDQYYSDRGELVEVQIIAFGPGLHMLRESNPLHRYDAQQIRQQALTPEERRRAQIDPTA